MLVCHFPVAPKLEMDTVHCTVDSIYSRTCCTAHSTTSGVKLPLFSSSCRCTPLLEHTSMSGRGGPRPGGRGVGRGRSRGLGAPGARRPGEPAATTPTSSQPLVGRGRGRAAPSLQQQLPQQPPPQQPPAAPAAAAAVAATAQPPTKQMEKMEIGSREKRQERGIRYSEPHTRPQHIADKRGTSGQTVNVFSNYVVLKNRPGGAIYQYNVSYNPPVESKGLRIGLLKDHEESLIGKTRAFDGMILYLPKRLPKDVVEVVSQTKDGQNITITIKLTNELSASSPICLQLLNITFRRSGFSAHHTCNSKWVLQFGIVCALECQIIGKF